MSTETTGSTPAQTIAAGYAVEGQALELGAVMVDGTVDPGAQIRIPLATVNRHGLVGRAAVVPVDCGVHRSADGPRLRRKTVATGPNDWAAR